MTYMWCCYAFSLVVLWRLGIDACMAVWGMGFIGAIFLDLESKK